MIGRSFSQISHSSCILANSKFFRLIQFVIPVQAFQSIHQVHSPNHVIVQLYTRSHVYKHAPRSCVYTKFIAMAQRKSLKISTVFARTSAELVRSVRMLREAVNCCGEFVELAVRRDLMRLTSRNSVGSLILIGTKFFKFLKFSRFYMIR